MGEYSVFFQDVFYLFKEEFRKKLSWNEKKFGFSLTSS